MLLRRCPSLTELELITRCQPSTRFLLDVRPKEAIHLVPLPRLRYLHIETYWIVTMDGQQRGQLLFTLTSTITHLVLRLTN